MDRISPTEQLRRGLLAFNPYVPRLNQMQARVALGNAPRWLPEQDPDISQMGAMLAKMRKQQGQQERQAPPREGSGPAALPVDPMLLQEAVTTPYGLEFGASPTTLPPWVPGLPAFQGLPYSPDQQAWNMAQAFGMGNDPYALMTGLLGGWY